MAIQSSFKNMVLCLFGVCVVCSALLAVVYAVTAEPIEAAAEAKTNSAIAQVVPAFEGTPVADTVNVDGTDYPYYTVSDASGVVGYAVISSGSGFSGPVQVMVGFYPDGKIYNTSVLSQAETPGLGAKCVEPEFRDQFRDFDPAVKKLSVTKEGGDVNAITASTITSKAFCAALNGAVAAFNAISGASMPVDVSSGASVSGDWEANDEGGCDAGSVDTVAAGGCDAGSVDTVAAGGCDVQPEE